VSPKQNPREGGKKNAYNRKRRRQEAPVIREEVGVLHRLEVESNGEIKEKTPGGSEKALYGTSEGGEVREGRRLVEFCRARPGRWGTA